MNCSPPGFSVHGIFTARILEGPGLLPDPRIKHVSAVFPALQVDSLPLEPVGKASLLISCALITASSSFSCSLRDHLHLTLEMVWEG